MGKLAEMAAEFETALVGQEAGAYCYRQLGKGLRVLLERRGSKARLGWRLALARRDVLPGQQEVAICMKAFGVPVGTEVVEFRKERQGIVLLGVEMVWWEAE